MFATEVHEQEAQLPHCRIKVHTEKTTTLHKFISLHPTVWSIFPLQQCERRTVAKGEDSEVAGARLGVEAAVSS